MRKACEKLEQTRRPAGFLRVAAERLHVPIAGQQHHQLRPLQFFPPLNFTRHRHGQIAHTSRIKDKISAGSIRLHHMQVNMDKIRHQFMQHMNLPP